MAGRATGISAKLSLDASPLVSSVSLAGQSLRDLTSQGLKEGAKLNAFMAEYEQKRDKFIKKLSLKPGLTPGGKLNSEWTPPGASSSWGPSSRWMPAPGSSGARAAAAAGAEEHEKAAKSAGKAEGPISRYRDVLRRTGDEAGKTGKASSRFGQGLLQIGYLADDAAYGMRGMMNNISSVALGIGLGSGVAGVLQILGAALQQGMKYWDDWSGATKQAENDAYAAELAQKKLAKSIEQAGEAGRIEAQHMQRRAAAVDMTRAGEEKRHGT